MRRRITIAIVAVTAFAVALFGIPLALVIRRLYVDGAQARLERQVTLAARDLVDGVDALPAIEGVTLTRYGPGGRRLAGPGPAVDERARAAGAAGRVRHREHGDRLAVYVPMRATTARPSAADVLAGDVLVGDTSIHAAEHRAHLAWVLMAALGGGVVLLAGGLGLLEAGRLARPVGAVRDRARRLGQGDFTIDVAATGVRELDELGDALATTATRLGEAMARERSFSANASHQLRTPLAGLRVTLESELVAPRPEPSVVLREALALTDRLEGTIDDLLRLARRSPGGERLNVARLSDQLDATWSPRFAQDGRAFAVVDAAPVACVVMAANTAVAQAADVLVDNARRHTAGAVTVRIAAEDRALIVRVTDEGPAGAAPQVDGGHGLGLGLAASLVEAEGGRLRLPTAEHPGTYVILLPLVGGDA